MTLRCLLAWAVTWMAGAAALEGAAPESAWVAFADVTVIPMDGPRVVPGQSVLVRDGRIQEMGPASDVPIPSGATRIEGRGRYLMPGLVDVHIHIPPESSDEARSAPEFLLLVAHGVTTARVMIGQPEHLALRDEIERRELLGPSLYVAGPPVGIPAGSLPGVPRVESPADAARVPVEQKAAGYDLVKVLDGLPRDQFDALVASARQVGIPVAGHVPRGVGLDGALGARQASIEHLAGYVEALIADDSPVRRQEVLRVSDVMGALDETKLPALVARTREAGVPNVPTLYFWRALISAETPEALLQRPGMEYVPAAEREAWVEQRRKTLAARPPVPETLAAYHALRLRITRALRDAGATLLLGTDSPDVFTVAGVAVHEELKLLVEAGLTPYEALSAGTREAAAFLGGAAEFGTVAVGRRADLLLLEANPLEDVAHASRRAGVMLRGRWLPADDLERRLEALRKSAGTLQAP